MNRDQEFGIIEVRKACRQFAMQYYHFCKALYEEFGEEVALRLAQKAVFGLSCDRAGKLRDKAEAEGLPLTLESFNAVTDLPLSGWTTDCGGLMCPYAETWIGYYDESPWFQKFASQYCDVIDTTNIEVFSGTLSHKITHNLVWGDDYCDREYFPSADVAAGKLSYGEREAAKA